MRLFTVGELQDLIRPRKGPCVSLYMPTHRRKEGADEDRIRFKNLVADARERVKATAGTRTATKLVQPLADVADAAFWQSSLDGLALFSAQDGVRWYQLAFELPERSVVSDSFHVRPLVRYLQTRQRFHVLALSAKGPKLFGGTRTELTESDVAGMPGTIESVVGERSDREGLSAHATGRGTLRFHGDDEARSAREDLSRYCRAVDAAVRAALRDDPGPVFLAGVTRHVATFRSVSTNPAIAPEGLTGNFDRVPLETLHARVLPLMTTALRARDESILGEYRRARGIGLATDELDAIGAAAVAGRVRTVLLCRGRAFRGGFDRATGEIVPAAPKEGPLGDDVTDDIAESVLVRGGGVHVFEADLFPAKAAPAAAILRW
jgi:hypothetical protein